MLRAANVLIAFVSLHALSAGAAFAQYCVPCAPTCACPSCAAPSCAVPTCACPGVCSGGCGSCQSCGDGICGHKKGLFNITINRTINRTKRIGICGEAPPAGFAVASIPAMTIATTAVPVNFATTAAPDRSAEIAAIAAILAQQQKANTASAAPASGGVCNDPCGDIKQLQAEVQQLKQITVNLTNVVEKLVDERPVTP